MDIVVSGTRPTGKQHLGNYFGAVANFIKFQNETEAPCYFFVADFHSLTTHPNPEDLKANCRQTVAEYLACGLNPEKSTLYLQSDIREIPELYLIFNMFAYKGELEKTTTFKDKVRSQPENVNAGLLTYPVLMAVDIIIHKATKVPVGKDQQQHIEMTRNFVKRFNHMYNTDYFPEPESFSFSGELVKVPGLDGKGKMSKSESEMNAIFLTDEDDAIIKKIKRAKTDAGPTVPNQEKPVEIANIFELMRLVSTPDTVQHFEEAYNKCEIRYGDMKKQLGEDMAKYITPFREKTNAILNDEKYLNEVIQNGAEKARKSASETLRDVREIIGLKGI